MCTCFSTVSFSREEKPQPSVKTVILATQRSLGGDENSQLRVAPGIQIPTPGEAAGLVSHGNGMFLIKSRVFLRVQHRESREIGSAGRMCVWPRLRRSPCGSCPMTGAAGLPPSVAPPQGAGAPHVAEDRSSAASFLSVSAGWFASITVSFYSSLHYLWLINIDK